MAAWWACKAARGSRGLGEGWSFRQVAWPGSGTQRTAPMGGQPKRSSLALLQRLADAFDAARQPQPAAAGAVCRQRLSFSPKVRVLQMKDC